MLTYSVSEFKSILKKLVEAQMSGNHMSVFMWGAPGIGKSSMVHQVGAELGLEVRDVRLSQLAPTDLRGLPKISPLAGSNTDVLHWVAPNFLPRDEKSKGILFLDEFNMCSGSMMGIAQQLVLDRKVGDYTLPPNWVIIAAGNRSTDRAAVSIMPAPVANRFLHFSITTPLDDFKSVAYSAFPHRGISNDTIGKVLGFLNFKPDLLNQAKISQNDLAFPTPRSWENAMRLLDLGIDTDAAIGEATSTQLRAYLRLFSKIPNLDKVLLHGTDSKVTPPSKSEPSIIYAIVSSLIAKSTTIPHYINSIKWLLTFPKVFTQDYVGLFASECMIRIRSNPELNLSDFAQQLVSDPLTSKFITDYRELLSSFNS